MTTEPQTCHRHADRRAGVRCQRCGQAICPDCMTQASVGFHCPQCVRSGSQDVRTARTIMQGATPYVTFGLIAINVAIYLLTSSSPSFELDYATIGRIDFGGTSIGVSQGEWWRIVSGGFLHASVMHIGFNMFALYILGKQLEAALGRSLFAGVYLGSLVAGSLGVLLIDPNSVTVGASGAVFGMFGYALASQKSRGVNPMDTGLGGIIMINLLFTFLVPGISKGGHIGGLVGGVVIGLVVEYVARPAKWPTPVTTAVVFAVGAAFAGATLAVAAGL